MAAFTLFQSNCGSLLLSFTEARHHLLSPLRWLEVAFLHLGHHLLHAPLHMRHHSGKGICGQSHHEPTPYGAQNRSKYVAPGVRACVLHCCCPFPVSCIAGGAYETPFCPALVNPLRCQIDDRPRPVRKLR
jgi:hypothetical protein